MARSKRAGDCDMPGPHATHCTEPYMHRYSCYDSSDDSSWNDRQDWVHSHPGCPDDGLVNEES